MSKNDNEATTATTTTTTAFKSILDEDNIHDVVDGVEYIPIRNDYSHSANSTSDSDTIRTILINNSHHLHINNNKSYCTNSISTSKYNIFTFFPKFFYEQFTKYSNVFFLMIVLLQVK
jgi:hypothetical protein